MRFKNLLALLTVVAACVAGAGALEHFISSDRLFSLSYPAEFTRAKTGDLAGKSQVALLLRHATQNYPTFNVLVQPTAYDTKDVSLAVQTSRVLESYRLVGITDARVRSSAITRLASRQAFSAEIAYQNLGQDFVSSLSIVPAKDQHLILTFVDYASTFEAHKDLRDEIFNSLKVYDQPPLAESSPTWSGKSKFMAGAILAALLLSIFILNKIRSRGH